jgi:hypothetical protein
MYRSPSDRKAFNINKISEIRNKNTNKNKELFEAIYSRVEKAIERAVISGANNCIYEVPPFIIGLPLYNVDEVLYYVNSKLVSNGFTPYLMNSNTINITWHITSRPSAISYHEDRVPEQKGPHVPSEDDLASSLMKYKKIS